MSEQTKACRMCGETIKSKAKRCPHCTSYLSIFNLPIIVAITSIAIIIVVRFSMPNPANRETIYDGGNKLVILDTSQKYAKDDCGTFIAIIGKLKNQTDKTWTDIHFEVKFFNDKNELVDTLNPELYSIVVAPHKETSFRIREKAAAHEGEYKRYEIKITKALEDFRFF